jgi:hypothetical protein
MRRRDLYSGMGIILGREYHTAETRTIEDARAAYRAAMSVIKHLPAGRPNSLPTAASDPAAGS